MKVLIFSNTSKGLYNFKKEFIEELINPKTYVKKNVLKASEVTICVPDDYNKYKFIELGCNVVNIDLERHGKNILKEFKLMYNYYKLIKKIKPDVVFTFTIKPNIYSGIVCQLTKTPYFSNITGLGTTIRNESFITKFIKKLYKFGTKGAEKIYFENSSDLNYFNDYIYRNKKSVLMPGSGINFHRFPYISYPNNENKINFVTIGRIMRDKGITELLEAAKFLKAKYKNIDFYIVGEYDEAKYKDEIENLNRQAVIKYLGFRDDISKLIGMSHCIIHPSYHEGLSNVLLEAAATGRPVIASYVPGCKETFINGVTGIAIEPKDTKSLINKIEEFIKIDYDEKINMGKKARNFVESKFNREIVIEYYIENLCETFGNQ